MSQGTAGSKESRDPPLVACWVGCTYNEIPIAHSGCIYWACCRGNTSLVRSCCDRDDDIQ